MMREIMANYRTTLIGVIMMAAALYQMWSSNGENTELLKHFTSPEYLMLLGGIGFVLTRDAVNKKDKDDEQ